MSKRDEKQYKQMTEMAIPKLVGSLALPSVISMLVTNIYNLADAFFVSKIGTGASGAVGIVSTLSLILLAGGLMFGHGSGSLISRALGTKNYERASILSSTAFFSALTAGIIISVSGLIFLKPLMRLLGSTETVLPYSTAYGFYILLAAPFTVSSFVLNNIMRYEGKARLSMIGLTFGAVLNIVLDPVFIFGFKMGVYGAGLSTALSQVVSFGILLYMYVSGRTECKISAKLIAFCEIPDILKNGLPTLARQGMNCVSSALLNQAAASFGDFSLAAVSIVNQICNFIAAIMIGIGQGYQPVAGYNFGAGKTKRLRDGFYFTFLLGEGVLFLLSVILFFASGDIISAFREDTEIVKIGSVMLKFQCISLISQPFSVCANMMFQSIGETGRATLLASTRNGIYMIPAVLILPKVLGIAGIQIAQSVADIFALLTAVPLVLAFFKKCKLAEHEKSVDN